MKTDAVVLLEAIIAFKDRGLTLQVQEDGPHFIASILEKGKPLVTALGVNSSSGFFSIRDEHLAAGFPEDGNLAPLKPYVDKAIADAAARHGHDAVELDQQALDNIYANALFVTACYERDLKANYKGDKVSYYVSLENPFGIRVHTERFEPGDPPEHVCQILPDLDELVDELVDAVCTT